MTLSAFAAQTPAACSANRKAIGFGAAGGKDLEPFSSPELLEELEDWSAQIACDPAVSQAIAELECDSNESGSSPSFKGPTR